ncbi:YfgM family protein [Shewanella intestini]|uniref:Ancillary SecYEG translocon subunit n=1 Tax=Shewanella intestini TaxID=2017544 RepID=A0ABS5I3I5_9GAMM|nr:tetratricopeptide repeat protein [Shewanella sp. XMDDZSB0408]MBR9728249.1 tetratricopeptide repeat protein [Shewanella intestini]MRG35714.1 tetratricopeptide repeat protein [Shewanella sp. XMDDZSB0408]
MEIYSTEEQQVDAIKQFWKDNGTAIIVGAVVGLGGLYGWNTYSDMKLSAAESASEQFQAITAKSTQPQAVIDSVEKFGKNHSEAGYQSLLDMMLAKSAVDVGDYTKAEQAFKKIIASKPGAGLESIATIRLARVQAEQGNVGVALSTLDQITDEAFIAQRDELKGDFLVRQGNIDKARLAYQSAVDHGGVSVSPALTIKLDNLNKA